MSRGLELEKAKRWSDAKAESGRGALGKDGHGPSRLRVNMPCPYDGRKGRCVYGK